jgi:hypothetical protein
LRTSGRTTAIIAKFHSKTYPADPEGALLEFVGFAAAALVPPPGQRNRILDAFRHRAESGRKPWVTKTVGEREREWMPRVIAEYFRIPANALCRTS